MQEIVRDAADVQELAEESFGEHLADYPGTELAWLQDLHNSTLGKVPYLCLDLPPNCIHAFSDGLMRACTFVNYLCEPKP